MPAVAPLVVVVVVAKRLTQKHPFFISSSNFGIKVTALTTRQRRSTASQPLRERPQKLL
jgi:hypothetical protein